MICVGTTRLMEYGMKEANALLRSSLSARYQKLGRHRGQYQVAGSSI